MIKNIKPERHTLYSITCVSNDRMYIGVCRWWKQRFCKHWGDLKRGNHANYYLQDDYNRYGREQFVIDIIQEYDDKREAERIEKYYTDVVFGLNKECCYNIISGGSNVVGQIQRIYQEKLKTNPQFKEDIYRRIGLAQKGKKISDEHKEKVRQAQRGKICSEATREKFRLRSTGGNNHKAKKVIDEDTGKIYSCLKDAAVDLGVKYGMIRGRINGYNKAKTSLKWL